MKFKCKASGCIVEFVYPVDIETTLANPAYEVVEETVEQAKPVKIKTIKTEIIDKK